MKLVDAKCKNCGAELSLDKDKTILFCPYCASKLYIIDGDEVKAEKARADAYRDVELAREETKRERDRQEHEREKEMIKRGDNVRIELEKLKSERQIEKHSHERRMQKLRNKLERERDTENESKGRQKRCIKIVVSNLFTIISRIVVFIGIHQSEGFGSDGNLTITIGGIDAFQSTIKLGAGKSTMYDNKGTSTIKGNAGDYDGNYAGRKVGEMSGVAIAQDGKITASYDNGTTKLLGQIAVANFANPSGLEKIGDNLYQTTPNSGAFDGIGEDITAGSGALSTGVLEMSNVDLSAEFTDMITTQRGFQANSRIITVSDSMLEELTNLKR